MATLSVTEALATAEQLFRAGKLDEMETLCHSILKSTWGGIWGDSPRTSPGDAHRFLGLAAYTRGRYTEAVAHVKRALALTPREPAAHDNLSIYLLALGKPVEAEAAAREALALQASLANPWHNLGLALRAQGRFAEAGIAFQESLKREPNNPDVLNNLATVFEQLRRIPEAVAALERALQMRPDFELAKKNLQRLQTPLIPSANPAAKENNRGVQLLSQKRYAEAEAAFQEAMQLAIHHLELSAEISFNLAAVYLSQRRFRAAEAAYRHAVSLELARTDPGKNRAPNILNNLGNHVLTPLGRYDESRVVYRKALAMQPDHAICHSNLLFNEQYAPESTLASLAEAHAEYETRQAAPLRSTWRPYAQSRDPERPLRVGFVSADLIQHPVALFLAPVIERLNGHQWFTVCYATQQQSDHVTRRLNQATGLWRSVGDLNDEALAQQIRNDSIDLLIDLSGHTGGNRLLAFARRPAPVQLTWAGYVGTTGLSAIDYLIADRFHVPIGWEQHYREKVLRLPDGYVCYQPPSYAPSVGPLPALKTGQVTFGSFNNLAKLNSRVVALWSDILKRVPRSRLLLKYHWLDDAALRQHVKDQFVAQGIAAERVELLGGSPHGDQLQQYNRVDLALDTFPYSGGLTTLEACWMGAPVLTCPGETFASRHSFSHLSNIGLTETIAVDHSDYIARAVSLVSDLPRLAELRSGLRQRMTQSPVCDLEGFTANFGRALRQVWREWCGTKG